MKVMSVEAQKLLLRMYTYEDLGRIYLQNGPWNDKKFVYDNCCNARRSVPEKDALHLYYCTLEPNHSGPHIAHAGEGRGSPYVVGAWVNHGTNTETAD